MVGGTALAYFLVLRETVVGRRNVLACLGGREFQYTCAGVSSTYIRIVHCHRVRIIICVVERMAEPGTHDGTRARSIEIRGADLFAW